MIADILGNHSHTVVIHHLPVVVTTPIDPDQRVGRIDKAAPSKPVDRQAPGRKREPEVFHITPAAEMLALADADLGGRTRRQAVPFERPGGRGEESLPDRACFFDPTGFNIPRPRSPSDASIPSLWGRLSAEREAAPHRAAGVIREQVRFGPSWARS